LGGNKAVGGFVEIYKRFAPDTLNKVGEIRLAGFYPTAFSFSPDTRHLAIAWADGTTSKTIIYRRFGNSFSLVMEVPAFGALVPFALVSGVNETTTLIGWTADGKYLVDAASRKAMKYESGVFSTADAIMANVPAGALAMTMSTHVSNVTGRGYLYDGAISDLVNRRVNLEALKFALLKSEASFRPMDAALSAVTANGEYEAHGFGWPVGGKAIPNVRLDDSSPSTLSYKGDEIKQVIVDGNLISRYGVIYDDSHASKKPLLFIDFQKELFAEKDTELTLTFDSLGFITYSA